MPGKAAGLDMVTIDVGGTKQADRAMETQLLDDHKNKNGKLPAGNKTCH
jgi:hypothetical protein